MPRNKKPTGLPPVGLRCLWSLSFALETVTHSPSRLNGTRLLTRTRVTHPDVLASRAFRHKININVTAVPFRRPLNSKLYFRETMLQLGEGNLTLYRNSKSFPPAFDAHYLTFTHQTNRMNNQFSLNVN